MATARRAENLYGNWTDLKGQASAVSSRLSDFVNFRDTAESLAPEQAVALVDPARMMTAANLKPVGGPVGEVDGGMPTVDAGEGTLTPEVDGTLPDPEGVMPGVDATVPEPEGVMPGVDAGEQTLTPEVDATLPEPDGLMPTVDAGEQTLTPEVDATLPEPEGVMPGVDAGESTLTPEVGAGEQTLTPEVPVTEETLTPTVDAGEQTLTPEVPVTEETLTPTVDAGETTLTPGVDAVAPVGEPKIAEEPVAEQPVAEEPVAEQPVVEAVAEATPQVAVDFESMTKAQIVDYCATNYGVTLDNSQTKAELVDQANALQLEDSQTAPSSEPVAEAPAV
jgi:hypothetical protein